MRESDVSAMNAQFAAALHREAEFPVPATEAIDTLVVLDAARVSAGEGQIVELPDSAVSPP